MNREIAPLRQLKASVRVGCTAQCHGSSLAAQIVIAQSVIAMLTVAVPSHKSSAVGVGI